MNNPDDKANLCRRCNSMLEDNYVSCPYCGTKIKKMDKSRSFSIAGYIIAVFCVTAFGVYYFHNLNISKAKAAVLPEISNQTIKAQSTPIASSESKVTANISSPTSKTSPLTPAPTIFDETPQLYGLSNAISYVEFIDGVNNSVNTSNRGLYTSTNVSIMDYSMDIYNKRGYKSTQIIKYNMGDDINITLWIIGKKLYISKINLTGKCSSKEHDKIHFIKLVLPCVSLFQMGRIFSMT